MAKKMVEHYEIRGKIGQGGMANVFLAYDTHMERNVALKVLDAYFAREPEFAARFEREAKTITSLEHSYIVPVYDYGRFKGLPYLVMRFMRGRSLRERLEEGPLTLTQAKAILQRIAGALDYAHENGIIHRDLKPDNILFDRQNNAFLGDFGIVKLAQSSTTFTQTGNTLGTPAYMSPEQAKAVEQLDYRSDIYSLGVILYEMLTGDIPYKADTSMGQAMMHILEPVPRILEVNPDLPDACQEIIQTAMAKDRDDRYASAGELAAAFEPVANSDDPTGSAATKAALTTAALSPTSTLASPGVPTPGEAEATPAAADSSPETLTPEAVSPEIDATTSTEGSRADGPQGGYSLDMQPKKVTGQGVVKILIHNEGNVDNTYTLVERDPQKALKFGISQRRLKVGTGQQETVEVKVAPRKRPFLGRNRVIPFQIFVSGPNSEPQSQAGDLENKPVIPLWTPLVFFSLILLVVAVIIYREIVGPPMPPLVDVPATQTAAAVAATQISARATQESDWLTQNAKPQDSDEDGISDIDEVEGGTDPDNPDSDDDGLSDGDERSWGSNPLVADTDGDTLLDGDEVNQIGTSPINTDTDGDGLQDNNDPDPGSPPTITPTPTGTPTATPTQTPTKTPTINARTNEPLQGSTMVRPADEMVMVYVPSGTFLMGSNPNVDPDANSDEQPQHPVTLSGFWIDRTEVTNAQYNICVAEGICTATRYANSADYNGDEYPVVGVNWNEAETYCIWAGGQLPTEAQWEYAARGDDGRLYPWGNETPNCNLANFGDCDGRTAPVGSFSPAGDSWVGAQDMSGNAWEWTENWFYNYNNVAETNPTGPGSGSFKVLRGGGFGAAARPLRAAERSSSPVENPQLSHGFRCAVPGN